MSADTLNPTTYNNVAANTVNNAVLDAAVILAWRQEVNTVVNQHATEMNTLENALWNAIINGNFAVNQRVRSGTVTLTAGQYGHDRWKAGASGCTYTFSTTNNVTTLTITAGSLIQVIEGVNLYSGTYTLSWNGTAQGKIGAGSYSASGVTGSVTGGANLNIEFNTGTLSKVQFNFGSVALPFQPRSFADELALCQRYYQKSYSYGITPGAINNLFGALELTAFDPFNFHSGGYVEYKVMMRTTPTTTIYAINGTAGNITVGSTVVAGRADPSFSNEKRLRINTTGTLTANAYYRCHFVSDAEL